MKDFKIPEKMTNTGSTSSIIQFFCDLWRRKNVRFPRRKEIFLCSRILFLGPKLIKATHPTYFMKYNIFLPVVNEQNQLINIFKEFSHVIYLQLMYTG